MGCMDSELNTAKRKQKVLSIVWLSVNADSCMIVLTVIKVVEQYYREEMKLEKDYKLTRGIKIIN